MDLDNYRQQLNEIDEKIIKFLLERQKISLEIAKYKKRNNLEIFQPKREEELLKLRRKFANQLEINEDFIEEIFKVILEESKRIQRSIKII